MHKLGRFPSDFRTLRGEEEFLTPGYRSYVKFTQLEDRGTHISLYMGGNVAPGLKITRMHLFKSVCSRGGAAGPGACGPWGGAAGPRGWQLTLGGGLLTRRT